MPKEDRLESLIASIREALNQETPDFIVRRAEQFVASTPELAKAVLNAVDAGHEFTSQWDQVIFRLGALSDDEIKEEVAFLLNELADHEVRVINGIAAVTSAKAEQRAYGELGEIFEAARKEAGRSA